MNCSWFPGFVVLNQEKLGFLVIYKINSWLTKNITKLLRFFQKNKTLPTSKNRESEKKPRNSREKPRKFLGSEGNCFYDFFVVFQGAGQVCEGHARLWACVRNSAAGVERKSFR